MENLLLLLSLIAFIMFIIGLFSPGVSLFFYKEKEKRTRKNSTVIYLVSTFVLGMLAAFISDPTPSSDTSANADSTVIDSTAVIEEEVKVEEVKEKSPWIYKETIDPMTDKTTFMAYTISTNSAEFKFPYSGGTWTQLTIRQKDGRNDVSFSINTGQFMPSYSGTEYARVRFDGSQPVTYYYSMSTTGSNNIIFINNTKGIINKLKEAKKITVDFPFFQEGRVIFNFDTQDLKWEH